MSPCRMEEASVAGESPDKSEQRKSSGTARSEHDPRLSVFREPAAPAESGGRTDTATAVFGTQRSESPADGESAAESVADAAETPEGPGSPVEAPEAAPRAPEEPEEPAGPAEGDEPAEAVDAAKVDAADSVEEPEGAAAEPGSDEAKPEPEPEPEPQEGDARLRAAVAAWVSTDDEAGDGEARDDEADGGSADGGPSDEEPAAEAEEPSSEPDEDDDKDSEREPDAKSDAKSDAKPDVKPDTESDKKADAKSDPDEDSAAEPKSDAEPEAKSEAKPDVKPDAKPDEDSAEKPDAEPGIDQATAVFKAPKLPRVDQPTTTLKVNPPSAAKPKTGAETDSARKSEPESPAERTSKFVPLRADDVRPAPAPRSPEAPAPEAGPERPSGATPAWGAQLTGDASLGGAERTRQQPMPPRPPLDLLAELTNTPPPPETPVRTAVRRVKIWTPLVLLLLVAFAIVQMVRPLPEPALVMSAESTYAFKGADLKLEWPAQGQSAVSVDGVGSLGSAERRSRRRSPVSPRS